MVQLNPLEKSKYTRWSWFALLVMITTILAVGFSTFTPDGGTNSVQAQDGENEDSGDDSSDEEGDDEDDAEKESFLAWMIKASGVFGFVLLLLSFLMVALIMMNVLQVRRDNLLPADFIDAFEQKLAAKDYQGAYEIAKNNDSFVARVLAAGLSKLNRGYDEAIEGMQEVGEDESMALEHRLSYLAMIGSIAPMIGLMGTVWGMIQSFQTIATQTTAPKPKELAGGISTALFTTLEGLTVAIPAMVFYGLLRNRVARFVLEVGMVSEGLMSRFSALGKKGGGGAPAPAPAAPKKEA